jgi:DNA-binding NtrC family response regulator
MSRTTSPIAPDRSANIRRRVMIVDDDPGALGALHRLVMEWGHDSAAFASFEDARAALTHKSAPDVLVVDVRLGMFNGLQLLHLAKQRNPQTTVVVMSGFDDDVLRSEATAAGASYMVKPIETAALRRLLSDSGTATSSRPSATSPI